MALYTRLDSPWSTSRSLLLLLTLTLPAAAQQLPEGHGKVETEKLCKGCHELARSVSLRQDRDGWGITMRKMVAFGIKAPEAELNAVFEYLVKNYPADEVPPLHINEASAIDLESRLSLKRSQAAAIIRFRNENGKFKTIEDILKVPGIDADKIQAKKDKIVF